MLKLRVQLLVLGATVGVASADVDVTETGALSTAMTFEVPAYHGITPHLGISYRSGSGHELAGEGWRLAAGSEITRRSATKGIARNAASDRFYLDGAELVPCTVAGRPSCSGGVAREGSFANYYSTRIERNRRIRRDPGGLVWTVWETDGTVHEYTSLDSGVSFQRRTTTDTFKNRVTYAWSCTSGCELDRITYGATEVRLFREQRPDPWFERTAAGRVAHTERLRSVVVRNDGRLLRAYALSYQDSRESRASLLTSVQQFGRDANVTTDGAITQGATAPLPAMTFGAASQGTSGTWSVDAETSNPSLFAIGPEVIAPIQPRYSGGTSLETGVQWESFGNPSDDEPSTHGVVAGDFTGDGRSELATWTLQDQCEKLLVTVNPTDVGTTRPAPISSTFTIATSGKCVLGQTETHVYTGDFNSDGIDDLAVLMGTELRRFSGATNGRFHAGAVIARDEEVRQCGVGDVDGDGRTDLVCEDAPRRRIVTWRATPSGWLQTTTSTSGALPDHVGVVISAGDVDGDGLADALLARPEGKQTRVVIARSLGNGQFDLSENQLFGFTGTLASADIDGDGLLDLAFSRTGTLDVALARRGWGFGRWEVTPRQPLALAEIVLADVDGDGRADLIGTDAQRALVMQRSIGEGVFAAGQATGAACDPNHNPFAPTFIIPADWNGDGLADPTCVEDEDDTFVVNEVASISSGVDRSRWMRADLDGDGALELVYIAYRNPGYVVHVVSPRTNARLDFTVAPPYGDPILREPAAARWIVADVGSSAGPADGKDDLVLVEHLNGRIRMTTMYSTGLATFSVVHTDTGAATSDSTLGWLPYVDDRDGRASLIRAVAPPLASSGIRIETLRPDGNGMYTFGRRAVFTSSPNALADRSVRGLRFGDLDGDGLTDVFHIDSSAPGVLQIRALLADGAGAFSPQTYSSIPVQLIGPRMLHATDLDGDGALDLALVSRPPGPRLPCFDLTQIAGDGRGGFVVGDHGGGACNTATDLFYTRLYEHTSGFTFVDLDQDGRPELVQLAHSVDQSRTQRLVVTVVRRDVGGASPQWRLSTFVPQLAYDLGDAWSWTPHADPSTGDVGFAYVHPQVSVLMRWRHVRDEMTSLASGLGLSTSITYSILGDGRDYLPSGVRPRVVTQIERRDLASAIPTRTTTTYGYLGARWSDEQRGLLGFATTTANDGTKIELARFELGEQCGARVLQQQVLDQRAALWRYDAIGYVLPGASAPFRCEIATTQKAECERTSTCRIASSSSIQYDMFGNAVSATTTVDGRQPSRTDLELFPNAVEYIVNRAARTSRYAFDGSKWQLAKRVSVSYDEQAWGMPPRAGGATSEAVWDDANGKDAIVTRQLDSHGNVIRTISPESRIATTIYDPTYALYPVRSCSAISCVDTTWDFGLGLPLTVSDPNGTTITTYDAHARVIQVDAPDQTFVRTKYLALGTWTGAEPLRQRIRTERSDTSADGVLASEAFFDGAGRTYRTTREDGASTLALYSDMSSRPIGTSLPYRYGTTPPGWIRPTYDGVGRVIRVQLADGSFRSTTYAVGTRTDTDEAGVTTVSRMDGAGGVLEIEDAHHAVTSYAFDALGRLVNIVDALGNTSVIDWSSRDQQIATRDSDRGRRTYRYTLDGQLSESVDAKGQRRSWTYDLLGRLASREDVDTDGNARVVTYTYDDGSRPHGTSFGRLVAIADEQANNHLKSERWYDAGGRVTRARDCVDRSCVDVGVQFDRAGRIEHVLYPDASGVLGTPAQENVTYRYDDGGRLVGVGDYASLQYEIDGALVGNVSGNGVVTTWTRSPTRGWLDRLEITGGTGTIGIVNYVHDNVGRVLASQGFGALAGDFDYTYDALGRLEHVRSPDPSRVEDFRYDAIGRLTYQRDLGDYRYSDPAHVHAMTSADRGANREYDKNGNTTSLVDPSGRELSLAWSADDKLVAADNYSTGDRVRMVYDASGRLVMRTDRDGDTRYVGTYVEIDSRGGLVKNYMAGDRIVARRTDGVLTYPHDDANRNTRLVTDKNGTVVARYDYSAFGRTIATASPPADIGFAAARLDSALGLITMGARTYDPTSARFLSADSVIPSLARPQSLDRYSYVENDPINYRDPSGHVRLLIELRKYRIDEESWDYESEDAFQARMDELFDIIEPHDEHEAGHSEDARADHAPVQTSEESSHAPGVERLLEVHDHDGVDEGGGAPGGGVGGFLLRCLTKAAPASSPSWFSSAGSWIQRNVLDNLDLDLFAFGGFEAEGGHEGPSLGGPQWGVKGGAEYLWLSGYNSRKGFYDEPVSAVGMSVERKTGLFTSFYAAGFAAAATDPTTGETHPGILLEGGQTIGPITRSVGIFGFNRPPASLTELFTSHDYGAYLSIKAGPVFVGVGASFGTLGQLGVPPYSLIRSIVDINRELSK